MFFFLLRDAFSACNNDCGSIPLDKVESRYSTVANNAIKKEHGFVFPQRYPGAIIFAETQFLSFYDDNIILRLLKNALIIFERAKRAGSAF